MACRSALGSMPSCSSKSAQPSRYTCRACACLPTPLSASISWPRVRSRSGCAVTSADSSPMTSECRPSDNSRSTQRSTIVSRCSSHSVISGCRAVLTTPASTGPRHSRRAARLRATASAMSPASSIRSASVMRVSTTSMSTLPSSRSSR